MPRESLALPRLLASILFALAAVFGLVAAVALTALLSGGRMPFMIAAATAPIAWVLTWLGLRLWTGRAIPSWFITTFFVTLLIGGGVAPAIRLLKPGTWMEALALLIMSFTALYSYASAPHPTAGDLPDSKKRDDLS
ncbi:hypothetical protein [Paludisphaera mucosa]|uniref:Uncharacterized protein n=1 Tax=Paludisphaera mucosa TaxID=3030827 RepID=A0ABT6FI63_9BACT|nr:hypothetical protein [Paludisphaera mucosa]MDG3007260.1 hypothetical protein [Paludisphaera mucosa]